MIHAHVSEQKFMFQIGIILPMVLTNAFHSTNLFLVFIITLSPAVNIALFSAYKTHPNCISSNYIIFSLFIRFLSTHSLDKNLLVPCLLFYFSQLVDTNCMHSITMTRLYFLHVPTIFNHFWNSVVQIKV